MLAFETLDAIQEDVQRELNKAVEGTYNLPKYARVGSALPEQAELVLDLGNALSKARNTPASEMLKSVAPQFQGLLGGAMQQAALGQQVDDMRKMLADLTKTEVTGTYPISGSQTTFGFAVYSLEAPSKKTFPVLTPQRNRFPRLSAQGSAIHWKAITAITGSGGSEATVNHFLAELPSNSVGGLTLNLPPEITFAAADKSATFKPIGLSGSNSMISQIAGRGFEDIRQLVGLSTLQALMLMEERGLSSGRTSAVAAPTIVSSTAGTPGTGQTAISGVTTNVYIQVTALTKMGETTASATTTTAATSSQVVTVVIGEVTGAEAYRVYVGTGTADPGVASHFKIGETGYNTFVIQGALPTAGNVAPTVDSTASSNAYLGYFAQMEAESTSYITKLNAALALADIQTAFQDRFDVLKADPEELWAPAGDRRSLSDLVLSQSGAAAQGYRINISPGETGAVAGVIVSAILNESTGREVPVRVDPWLHRGNLVGLSYTLPFPNSEIPNVWAVVGPQDYLAIDWPVIDMNYRTSVIAYNALVGYAPGFNFWIKDIKSATPTIASQ